MKIYLFVGLFLFSTLPSFASESWRLCSRVKNGTEFSMLNYKMDLTLEANYVSGSGGCNHYGGEVAHKSDLLFENIRITQKACLREDGQYDLDLMEAEEYFLSVLSSAQRMTMNDGDLRIFNGDGDELRFAPEGSCQR